jgi:hypothetical protein
VAAAGEPSAIPPGGLGLSLPFAARASGSRLAMTAHEHDAPPRAVRGGAAMDSAGKGSLVVYTIVERERDGKKFWVRIGAAFRNRDGSMNVMLDAVPVNGTMHIREPKLWAEREMPMPTDGDLASADALAQ